MLSIHPIPAFQDNYIWAIKHLPSNQCILVDPGDATPAQHFLQENHLTLHSILITHHHQDHCGGVNQLVAAAPCPVYGPATIDCCDHPLQDQDQLFIETFGLNLQVMATPGHTLDHIVYYNDEILFCGDTLFSAGCGRLFEGTAQQMFTSLHQLAQLNDETLIYCAHEYTMNNLAFAQEIEPDNKAIVTRRKDLKGRACTLPSTLKLEKQINPFLRCTLKQGALHDNIKLFSELRHKKDHW